MTDFITAALTDESKHFTLAFSLGLSVYWLTWIISCAVYSRSHRWTQRLEYTGVGYGIRTCCLLLGLSAALASHWLLDYWPS